MKIKLKIKKGLLLSLRRFLLFQQLPLELLLAKSASQKSPIEALRYE